ncbi:hypothetical protein [Luteolibacter soli]|uniref:Uncharacterized protein n=1 Tax=Luteolibacter soli TaxID=3135280 RepID=A0ABU9AX39_9BACT
MKFAVLSLSILGIASGLAQQIEVSPHHKPYTRDATVDYVATTEEAKFDSKKPDSDVGGDPDADAKKPGSLLGKTGKLISWFGIVRELPAKPSEPFLIEHKHYDGLNDDHIQLASLYGVGDFKVTASDPRGNLKRLSLVRVIGTVTGEKDKIPTVKADYIRVWHLGDFTFMDYGADATNEKWKKLRQKVDLIYSPQPDAKYYEKLLGK